MTLLAFSQVYEGVESVTGAGSISVTDIVIYVAIAILIGTMIWLSLRSIKTSSDRIQKSEKSLEVERDSLERRIAERTADFIRAEERRMIELQKNAEFGKLSQGLFHDLISPLSSVSLYARQLEKDTSQNYSDKTKKMIKTVIDSSRRMNSFMESVRRSLGNGSSRQDHDYSDQADIGKEVNIVLDILGYKARMAGVNIKTEIKPREEILLPIHPVRLHQLILNLVSNAIDACIQASAIDENLKHSITISIFNKVVGKKENVIELSVSDTGCGISKENQAKMFKEKFTTKKDGIGIGLMTVKTIVEKDLKGTIGVESEVGKGTRFVVRISNSNFI